MSTTSPPSAAAETLCYHCFDATIGIRAERNGLIGAVLDRLPPCWQPTVPGETVDATIGLERRNAPGALAGDTWTLLIDGRPILRSSDRTVIARAVEDALHVMVAAHSHRFVFVRAGVVRHRDRVILLPGAPGAGTTALVEALVRCGAAYFSDAFAILDREGGVHPYAVPLAARQPSDAPLKPLPAAGPCGIGVIACLRYGGPRSWHVSETSLEDTARALIAHTLFAHQTPERTLRALSAAFTADAAALSGERGEADEAAQHLLALLDN
ncbi:MAG: hypothetical protein IPM60_08170 [Rhodospirillales bacterium]|nr:hypothetical protein [Rhodospirillales bacterium]